MISFAMGTFALLPVYLLSIGRNEIFFGSISSAGMAAAIFIVLLSPTLTRQFSVRRLAPVGGLLYAAGCATMLLNELSGMRATFPYFLSYMFQSGGWALHFTMGSICISALSSDADRPSSFMAYSAFSTLGLTCGPLLGSLLTHFTGLGTVDMFVLAMLAATTGSALSFWAVKRAPNIRKADIPNNAALTRDLSNILFSNSSPFFLLVLLSASIYTTLVNFQAPFASQSGLPYEIFFGSWAIAVVGSRFAIGPRVTRSAAGRTLPLLLGGMGVSLLGFHYSPGHPTIYAVTSLMTGITYGLSYPLMQSEAVRVTAPQSRTFVQIIFSLSYFLGLYLFPFVAGLVSVHLGYDVLTLLIAGLALLQTVIAILGYRAIRRKPAPTVAGNKG
ncbi:MFS transporter [Mesorhizobium sp. J8]|uniref:MFS transporter n=1 Tax=Mesorhizobium sp. J8 TaxID=2777475 RepID=UPI001915E9A5|nr:MFS transporter [Mesorhizobium sp. J8]